LTVEELQILEARRVESMLRRDGLRGAGRAL
jgi:hypothetical protein